MTKKIHKEGYGIVATGFSILAILIGLSVWQKTLPLYIITAIVLILVCFTTWFFRDPERSLAQDEDVIFSPADGKVIICEEVDEDEYLKERRIQISIFMSVWNVHANNYPIGGIVEYCKHYNGNFKVAWHPKASDENERTVVVVQTESHGRIMFRQIAGLIARRIVCYAEDLVGKKVEQNQKLGFIKFGSRMDIFLPLNSEVKVKLGDKVKSTRTVLARLP